MNKIKRLGTIASILIFMLMMSPTSYTGAIAAEVESKVEATENTKEVRLQDDFYDAINSQVA